MDNIRIAKEHRNEECYVKQVYKYDKDYSS